ncbi:glycosyltransferase [Gryllotalpicola ginsengisoli]|uniref:glycosyltransferase n=1 Tax=Gryllotalpicola ginsengisoli TaxID=444608 RepID=UPI0003B678D7|nr:glycosyltransferase [Gryllotalpicola ginsengisoli]
MRILIWHMHGGWTDAFVRGGHEYLLPHTPAGGPWGLGRAGRDWPGTVKEVAPAELAGADVDVVVLQRTEELALAEQLLGAKPGVDVPAVFVEHNTPRVQLPESRHPLADQDRIAIVHVTPFNALMWDNGDAPVRVVEHGLPDPGYRYTGELPRLAMSANEAVRRRRVLGTDLLPQISRGAPIDVFGIGADEVPQALGAGARVASGGDLPTAQLHAELARRRAYLHTARWTSLGLSLIEAMLLGMPVLALATTQVPASLPPEVGELALDPDRLARAAARYAADPERAREHGLRARDAALERFALPRFLADWDDVLEEAVARVRRSHLLRRTA